MRQIMNSAECTNLQTLIKDLDYTRQLYAKLQPLLVRPYLKCEVEWISYCHATVADALASHMETIGQVTPCRSGGVLVSFRCCIETWLANVEADIDLGCLNRIVRNELRVIRRLQVTLNNKEGLYQSLCRNQGQLERAVVRVGSLMNGLTSFSPNTRKSTLAMTGHRTCKDWDSADSAWSERETMDAPQDHSLSSEWMEG